MRFRSLARWITLAASCLTLVGAAAPMRDPSRIERPAVTMMMGAAIRPVRTVSTPRAEKPRPGRVQARTHAPAPRPTSRAAPPLYVLHRALLR